MIYLSILLMAYGLSLSVVTEENSRISWFGSSLCAAGLYFFVMLTTIGLLKGV